MKDELKFDEDIFMSCKSLLQWGEFANDTKQVYKVPSGLTESNQQKQAHFIYATVTGNKTKILLNQSENQKFYMKYLMKW